MRLFCFRQNSGLCALIWYCAFINFWRIEDFLIHYLMKKKKCRPAMFTKGSQTCWILKILTVIFESTFVSFFENFLPGAIISSCAFTYLFFENLFCPVPLFHTVRLFDRVPYSREYILDLISVLKYWTVALFRITYNEKPLRLEPPGE